jgi:hypothetical protein
VSRLESLDSNLLERRRQQPLNVTQQPRIRRRDERYRAPSMSGAAGATGAVDVILGDERQVVVDDERQLRDVETARRDVGGDKDADPTRLEVTEGPRSCALALVAVNDGCLDAGALQVLADAIRTALGLAEDERWTGGLRQQMREHGPLLINRDGMQLVRHGRGGDLPV